MKKYFGTKEVMAQPMTALEAINNGYKVGSNNPTDGYEVVYPDGYKSWSPKKVFEDAYKEVKEYKGDSGIFKVDDSKNMFAYIGGNKDNKSKISIGILDVNINGIKEYGISFLKLNKEQNVNTEINNLDEIYDDNELSFVYVPHSKDIIDFLIENLNILKENISD